MLERQVTAKFILLEYLSMVTYLELNEEYSWLREKQVE